MNLIKKPFRNGVDASIGELLGKQNFDSEALSVGKFTNPGFVLWFMSDVCHTIVLCTVLSESVNLCRQLGTGIARKSP